MEKIEKLTKSKTFKNEKIIERKEKRKEKKLALKRKKKYKKKMIINFYRMGKMKKKKSK